MGKVAQIGTQGPAQARPPEEWGNFVREVGIIVLGVLIALVIGEIANAVRQKVEARRSMAAVRADMIDNSSAFEMATQGVACAERRLDALSKELAIVRTTGRLRNIGEIGRPPGVTFRSGSWDSAVANRDVLFLDKVQVAELTDYHELLRTYRVNQDELSLGWARLGVMSNAAGPMNDDTFAAVSQIIAELRYRTRFQGLMARLLLESHRRLRFPVVYTPVNGQPQTREGSFRRMKESAFCRRLDIADAST